MRIAGGGATQAETTHPGALPGDIIESAGLTQQPLADKIGISREYGARIETGHHEPSLTMLLKIAQALGTTREA